jgi:hypothetical protein
MAEGELVARGEVQREGEDAFLGDLLFDAGGGEGPDDDVAYSREGAEGAADRADLGGVDAWGGAADGAVEELEGDVQVGLEEDFFGDYRSLDGVSVS